MPDDMLQKYLGFVSSLLFGLSMATLFWSSDSFINKINSRYFGYKDKRALELGLDLTGLMEFMKIWWFLLVGIVCLLWFVLDMMPIAITLALIMVAIPNWILHLLLEQRQTLLRNQLVIASRLMVSHLKSGMSLPEAMRKVSIDAPLPIGNEFKTCVAKINSGTEIKYVLLHLKNKLKIDVVSLFCISLEICQTTGGDLGKLIEKLSRSIEEIQRLERKRESETQGGRLLISTLTIFPIIFGLLMFVIDPRSTSVLLFTYNGQCVLSGVMLTTYFAMRWGYWIIMPLE